MRFRRKDTRREQQLIDAQLELAEVRRQGTKRAPLIQRLREHSEVNHFAERFEEAMKRRRSAT